MSRFDEELSYKSSSEEEEEESDEEEDLAILMMIEMDQNKRLNDGASCVNRELIRRRR